MFPFHRIFTDLQKPQAQTSVTDQFCDPHSLAILVHLYSPLLILIFKDSAVFPDDARLEEVEFVKVTSYADRIRLPDFSGSNLKEPPDLDFSGPPSYEANKP